MNTNDQKQKPHSAEFFGEYRDFWWNKDFLDLMASRLNLTQVNKVLDVGCGIGHWGQLLSDYLPSNANLIGIDREKTWVDKASKRAVQFGLSDRYRYQEGDTTQLPFLENTFDMVTCQTVLIHLKDPRVGLREMLRVLKPGGLLLVAEPNNFANSAVVNSITESKSIEDVMDLLRFWFTCERGKQSLGLGYNSIGDLIPGYLSEMSVSDIRVYQNDKAVALYPPYATQEQQASVRQSIDWADREILGWDKEEAQQYFLAAGESLSDFEVLWRKAINDSKRIAEAIKDKKYYTTGGGIFYLISARKSLE